MNDYGDILPDANNNCNDGVYHRLSDGRHVLRFSREVLTDDSRDYRIEVCCLAKMG